MNTKPIAQFMNERRPRFDMFAGRRAATGKVEFHERLDNGTRLDCGPAGGSHDICVSGEDVTIFDRSLGLSMTVTPDQEDHRRLRRLSELDELAMKAVSHGPDNTEIELFGQHDPGQRYAIPFRPGRSGIRGTWKDAS